LVELEQQGLGLAEDSEEVDAEHMNDEVQTRVQFHHNIHDAATAEDMDNDDGDSSVEEARTLNTVDADNTDIADVDDGNDDSNTCLHTVNSNSTWIQFWRWIVISHHDLHLEYA
jgi:hypothetical protein